MYFVFHIFQYHYNVRFQSSILNDDKPLYGEQFNLSEKKYDISELAKLAALTPF